MIQFDATKSLDENIEELFFSETAFFTEEQIKTLITSDKANPTVPAFVTDVVEYQNIVKIGKKIKSIEIDLLGVDGKNYVLAGECKFKSEKFDRSDLENFLEKLKYLPANNFKIMLFSLSGFSDYVIKSSRDYKLIDINQMYR